MRIAEPLSISLSAAFLQSMFSQSDESAQRRFKMIIEAGRRIWWIQIKSCSTQKMFSYGIKLSSTDVFSQLTQVFIFLENKQLRCLRFLFFSHSRIVMFFCNSRRSSWNEDKKNHFLLSFNPQITTSYYCTLTFNSSYWTTRYELLN